MATQLYCEKCDKEYVLECDSFDKETPIISCECGYIFIQSK